MNKARVYKLTIELIDFEYPDMDIQTEEFDSLLENNYFNIKIIDKQSRVINNWSDDHPLNKDDTHQMAFKELFKD